MVVRVGGIRKFTFDVSNKNGTAHREFRRNQVEFVRLQSLRKMTGEGIGKRGRLALVFNLRVIFDGGYTTFHSPNSFNPILKKSANQERQQFSRM